MRGAWQAPLWSLGFRPFYLLGAAFAALGLPLWVASTLGVAGLASRVSLAWHAHEMLFGFAPAIMTGFLFTAVRNWTGQPTPTGAMLAALAALWLSGRFLLFACPGPLAALVDGVFLPVVAIAIAVPILRSANARNYKVIAIVVALAVFNLAQHLAAGGAIPGQYGSAARWATLDLFAILMAIVGGRVIPAFTGNAVPGARLVRSAVVEGVALGALVVLLLLDLARGALSLPAWLPTAIAALAALAHGVRLALWFPWQARGNALLWMLPVAYGWIPVALALRVLGEMGRVPPVLAVHGLTAGAMGCLMLAMMMRSTLGHTGRPLAAGPWEAGIFLLAFSGAALRVFGTLAWPAGYGTTLAVAGGLWSGAFGLFLWRYAPMLVKPRVA